MRTKSIVACVVVVAVLFFVTCLFIIVRQPSPAITVQHIKCFQLSDGLGDGFIATFGVTNRRSGTYSVIPLRIEVRNGLAWEVCADGITGFAQSHDLSPHGGVLQACVVKKLPARARLRVIMNVRRELKGIDSFLLRLQRRVTKGDTRCSLNPFDKKVTFFSKPIAIVSNEFVEPEPN